MTVFSRFIKDQSGATAIEYALIAAIIGVGLITALGLLKNDITEAFGEIGKGLDNAQKE